MLFLPKSKELTDYLLNALASRLAGRELYLVGENAAASNARPSSSTLSANRASSTARGTASCGK